MSSSRVTVHGFDELIRELMALAGQASPRQLETALRAGGLKIEGSAVRKAAVETGALRSSIHTETYTTLEGSFARVGTNLDYALPQEFGTYRMPAHPFLRPAYDEQRMDALRAIASVLKKLVTPK